MLMFQLGGFQFQNALQLLDQLGFTDVLLPFILIFTVVFAVLQNINIFGSNSRKFNSIISLALAIGVVIPHSLGKYPPGADVVNIINAALPNVSLLIVAVVFLLVVIGIFGGRATWGSSWIGGIVTLISVGLIVFIFGQAAGWWESSGVFYLLADPNVEALLLVVIVFWLIISVITQEEGKEGGMEELGKFFGSVVKKAAEGEKK